MKVLLAQFLLLFADGKLKANELAAFSKTVFGKIKNFLIKKALVRIVGSVPAWLGGPIGWVGTMFITLAIDKTLKPMFQLTILKIWVGFKSKKFKKEGKDLEESKTESDFDNNFDNMS